MTTNEANDSLPPVIVSTPRTGSASSQAYDAMVEKKLRTDRSKAIAFDLLKVGGFLDRKKAAESLTIARRAAIKTKYEKHQE